MQYSRSPVRMGYIRSVACALLVAAAAAACRSSEIIRTDRCFILVAAVEPEVLVLQIGDTMTLRAAFFPNVSPDCLPRDTTAAGLRWVSTEPAALTIDSVTGQLIGRRPGWSQIIVEPVGGGGVLGTTFASVLEPPGADSLISLVANLTSDSATVVLEDATGSVLRTVTLHASGVTCWNTPLSDSVRYSAQVYLPGTSGATPIGAKWVVHGAFASTHTWRVNIDPQTGALPTLDLAGIQPDRGC
jgi:hypothetical protein